MVNLLFDSWRGHTLDNGIMDLEDDAYVVLVLSESEEEEGEESPAKDEAGPSGTTGDEEPQPVDGGENLFQNLDEESSGEKKQSNQDPVILCVEVTSFNGDVVTDGD